MECQVIFYIARRTYKNEEVLKEQLNPFGICIKNVFAAMNPGRLASSLINAVKQTDLIFIIGGLSKDGSDSVTNVLKKILRLDRNKIIIKSFGISNGQIGYVLESGCQMMVLLPDDPDKISSINDSVLLKYIAKKYGLSQEDRKIERKSNLEEILKKFDTLDESDSNKFGRFFNLKNGFGRRYKKEVYDEKPDSNQSFVRK